MKEISLHILDIMQNSVTAGASLIELFITESADEDVFKFYIKDDGCGMDEEFVKNVTSPFTTKRTTRKVGLGIPLLKLAAEITGGGIEIDSEVGVGTKIEAFFSYSSIDRMPLGNIVDTMFTLITSYPEIDFLYTHKVNDKEFILDTRQMREILAGVPFTEPDVSKWIHGYLKEGEEDLYL